MDERHQHHPYGVSDFRQLMAGAMPPPELFPSHHRSPQPMELMMMAAGNHIKVHGHGAGNLHNFQAEASAAAADAAATALEVGDGASARWPRQETLTLLEIRSRLDSRFREANQKGPLWDEVSRIMSEEHGYQRSGKKCREKFENLYKYYKKTKEGKAGRHDGKHYRFFRQLEALYGDRTSNGLTTSSVPGAQAMVNSLGSYHPSIISPQSINPSNDNHELSSHQSQKAASDSLSLSGSSDFDTSSSNDDDDSGTKDPMVESTSVGTNARVKKRRAGRSWKAKIKDFIDSRMRKLIEKQEEWVEKMMRALEEKEQERLLREEEWRRQEIARIDKEHKFWAKERAWIEARDAALMEAIHNLTSRSSSDHMMSIDNDHVPVRFESEKANKTKTNADGENMAMDGSMKKGEEYYDKESKGNLSSRCSSNNYFQGDNISLCDQRPGVAYCEISEQGLGTARVHQLNDSFSPSNSIAGNVAPDSCFRFLMGDGENLWENYGMKLNKGEN